jgi:dTDP-4-amino-4,6-dideoxygalactose transaminase
MSAGRYPKLPILGWAAFAGERVPLLPGVLDARYRRDTTSGHAAIGLALEVIGVKPAERVLVPTYYCPTMIAPIVQAGAQPVFYPITGTGGADMDWIRRGASAGARAMLVVHYFGLPQPMAAVRAFCNENGISLIEDCAHAFFGVSDGRPVGQWGDIAIASLTKFFPVPEGGMMVSSTRALGELELSPRGWLEELKAVADAIELGTRHGGFAGLNAVLRRVFGIKNWLHKRDIPEAVTRDARTDHGPDSVASQRLLSSRPAFAARWIANNVHRARIAATRRRNYAQLAVRLSRLKGAHAPFTDLPDNAVPYVFPLYVNEPEASYQRLRGAGIPIFRWDQVWPGTPVLPGDRGVEWASHLFQLGCHQDLTSDQVDEIADTVVAMIDGPPQRRNDAVAVLQI